MGWTEFINGIDASHKVEVSPMFMDRRDKVRSCVQMLGAKLAALKETEAPVVTSLGMSAITRSL
jgi:hypothetical protein